MSCWQCSAFVNDFYLLNIYCIIYYYANFSNSWKYIKFLNNLFFSLRTRWFILVPGYPRTFLLMSSRMKEAQALPATSSQLTPEAVFLWQDTTLRVTFRGRLRVQQNTILFTLLEWTSPPQVPLSEKEGGADVGLWRKKTLKSRLWRKMRGANRSASGLYKCRLLKKEEKK